MGGGMPSRAGPTLWAPISGSHTPRSVRVPAAGSGENMSLREWAIRYGERHGLTRSVVKGIRWWRALQRDRYFHSLFRKYRQATKLEPHSYVDNLRLCHLYRTIPGCVVECGVWRAGMAAGIAEVLGSARSYYLLDSSEGLPDPRPDLDGQFSIDRRTLPGWDWDNCAAPLEAAKETMARSGARSVEYVQGWFK